MQTLVQSWLLYQRGNGQPTEMLRRVQTKSAWCWHRQRQNKAVSAPATFQHQPKRLCSQPPSLTEYHPILSSPEHLATRRSHALYDWAVVVYSLPYSWPSVCNRTSRTSGQFIGSFLCFTVFEFMSKAARTTWNKTEIKLKYSNGY